jgi:hypothetical protein
MVARVKPAVVGMAEAIEFANVDHARRNGPTDEAFKCQPCNRAG